MTVAPPQISVIVPVYNVEPFLATTLESVISQTLTDLEVIVVDDGSTDGSRAIAEAFAARDPRITLIHQANQGLSGARNTGFRASNPQSRAVIFLDSDDWWEPHALAVLMQALDDRPDAAGVYGAHIFFDDTGRSWPDRISDAFGRVRAGIVNGRAIPWPIDAPTTFDVMVTWPPIATSGQVLLRREAMPDTLTPFEPGILSEDWLFWLQLTQRGCTLYPHWEFVLHKFERTVSLSRGREFGKAELIVRRKLLADPHLTPAQRRTAWAGHRYAVQLRRDWAVQALREGDVTAAAKKLRHFVMAMADYRKLRTELGGLRAS
jgi:hypothetical protein